MEVRPPLVPHPSTKVESYHIQEIDTKCDAMPGCSFIVQGDKVVLTLRTRAPFSCVPCAVNTTLLSVCLIVRVQDRYIRVGIGPADSAEDEPVRDQFI